MTKLHRNRRRVGLLRIANGVQWLGLLLNFLCWGYALWGLASSPRFSDAIGDAIALALAGGLGFAVAWVIAEVIRRFAAKKALPATPTVAPIQSGLDGGGRDQEQPSASKQLPR
jgi:hypothetical protein